jgi:hypothetical protein
VSSYDDESRTGFHPVNVGHLVMGIALALLVGVWALWQSGTVENADVRWLMPIPWVAAGIVGLAASAVTGGRRHATRQTGWVTPQETPKEAPREQEEPTSDEPAGLADPESEDQP